MSDIQEADAPEDPPEEVSEVRASLKNVLAEQDEAAQEAEPHIDNAESRETVEPEETDPMAPVSFSPAAKAAIAKLKADQPLSGEEGKTLVAALDKREREINNGFAKLQNFKGLEDYAKHYEAHGVTIKQALESYTAAEQLLQQDLPNGLAVLIQQYGVNPHQVTASLVQKFGMPAGMAGQDRTPGLTEEQRTAVSQLMQHSQDMEQHAKGLEKQVRTLQAKLQSEAKRITVSRARDAGASISGGPSATPSPPPDDSDLRTMLERNFATMGGRV